MLSILLSFIMIKDPKFAALYTAVAKLRAALQSLLALDPGNVALTAAIAELDNQLGVFSKHSIKNVLFILISKFYC